MTKKPKISVAKASRWLLLQQLLVTLWKLDLIKSEDDLSDCRRDISLYMDSMMEKYEMGKWDIE